MSTAENAGRPVGPPAASSGSARRAPYADGGSAGGRGTDGGDNRMQRMADGDAGSGSGPTTPVPVTRASAARPVPAGVRRPLRLRPRWSPPASRPRRLPLASRRRALRTARRVRLTVSRVDPWSAMKIAFLLSVAMGIAGVVMVFVLWTILAGMGVFDQINGIVGQVVQDGQQRFDIMDFVGLGRVVSLSIVIAVIDVILVTAIATLGAFLYNVSSALVGGVQLTLTDD